MQQRSLVLSFTLTCLIAFSLFAVSFSFAADNESGNTVKTSNASGNNLPSIAPGLWEHHFTVEGGSGEIQNLLAQAQFAIALMPPEQRKMIEDMAKAQGVDLNLKNQSAKTCITPDQAKKAELPNPIEYCTQSITNKTENGFSIRYQCQSNPPVSGRGEIVFHNDKQFSVKAILTTELNNAPQTVRVSQRGKWLSHNCTKS